MDYLSFAVFATVISSLSAICCSLWLQRPRDLFYLADDLLLQSATPSLYTV